MGVNELGNFYSPSSIHYECLLFFLQLIVLYRDGVASSFVDKILASRVYYPKDRTVEVLEMRSPTILILEFGQSKGLFYGNDNNLTHFYF